MAKTNKEAPKAKAPRIQLGSLVVTNAWERTFSSGKTGWFGQVITADGTKYQVIGAVKIEPKS